MVGVINIDVEIDLKGDICPYTFVKTKLALEEMERGKILRVVVDHEPAIRNVPRSLENEGHHVLVVDKIGNSEWEIVIKKKS